MFADRPFRILIIEDDQMDREIYKRCLQQSWARRFEFAEADSAQADIEISKKWRPDCALLDFHLPDLEGIEALDILRGQSDRLPFPVIMLTAFGCEELAVRAMKA